MYHFAIFLFYLIQLLNMFFLILVSLYYFEFLFVIENFFILIKFILFVLFALQRLKKFVNTFLIFSYISLLNSLRFLINLTKNKKNIIGNT